MVDLFRMHDRSEGLHVSSAIKRIMESLHPDRFGGDEGPNQTRMMLGNAMEAAIIDALAREYPDRYVKPGECEFDDVFGTPDLWDIIDWQTVEIKLTWASSRRAEDIEDPWFFRYWVQIMAYCLMCGQTTGRLIIIFINGDYSRGGTGGQPTVMMWEWTWTDEELKENWAMLKRYLMAETKKVKAS